MKVETKLTFIKKKDIGGEGRNSKVFIAEDIQLATDLVVKEIEKKEFIDSNEYYTEAKHLYASKHPNIVEINYACEDDKNIYLSMPYYKNGSINSLINQRFLTVKEIIIYGLEFLSGLHYIHTKGLLHFDIKPTNIMISDSNTALVTNFGLAKHVNSYGFATPEKLYPPHAAPEAYITRTFDVFFDIYHCGLTLYRMCNGNTDFYNQMKTATQADVKSGAFPNRNHFLPHIPRALQNVIKRALEVNPTDRYNSVLEMLNDLSKIDKNLKWLYTEDNTQGTYVWEIDEEKMVKSISIVDNNGSFAIEGKQFSKGTKKTSNVSKWTLNGYTKREEAFKKVSNLIKEYENPKK